MTRRVASSPPEIAGFTALQVLGSGGFADVFLYEQKLPRRRVAVKVLLPDRISTSAAQFTAEANVMAMLSTHPSIVTIYQAGVADDGRPYLVMEYCPRPNLQVRYRREAFSIGEALHTGIPVAAAVETAHRAGVLHRDIKPANILVTEYNRPALTDFGIASTSAQPDESQGVSIPWSPPEAFADPPRSGVESDVYQLGATLFTLLAGRSPFEVPGQSNASAALIDRIERLPLPAFERDDVPASLRAVLERAMAKDASARFPSAVAFARALQKVQIELGHPVTPIDILDDHPEDAEDPGAEPDDIGETRIRRLGATRGPRSPAAGAVHLPVSPPAPAPAAPFEIPREAAPIDHSAFAPPGEPSPSPTTGFAPESTFAPPAAEDPAGPAESTTTTRRELRAARGTAQGDASPDPRASDDAAALREAAVSGDERADDPAALRPDARPSEDRARDASADVAAPEDATRAAPDGPAAADPAGETFRRTAGETRADPAPPAADAAAIDDATVRRAPRAGAPDPSGRAPRDQPAPPAVEDPAPDETIRRAPRPPERVAPPDDATRLRDPRPGPAEAPVADETVIRARAERPARSAPAWVPPAIDDVSDETVARPRRGPSADPVLDYAFESRVEIDASSVPKADPAQFRTTGRDGAQSVTRAPSAAAAPEAAPAPRRRVNWPLVIGLATTAIVVAGAVAGVLLWVAAQRDAEETPSEPATVREVPPVEGLEGTIEGDEVTFTWRSADSELGDAYLWGIAEEGRLTEFGEETADTSVVVPLQSTDQTCIEVILQRGDGNRSPLERACVTRPGAAD
ncbi:protein kinase domain-containing protein [Microbacterium sp. gxy059]|uniref:serine/threonine-protein kinase n=1 Tax=Microbacterium sp. gxy059 TaxID=2957199 RepID=UPI003D9A0008